MKVANMPTLTLPNRPWPGEKTPVFPRKTGQAARHGIWQCEAAIAGQNLLLSPLVRQGSRSEFGDVPWPNADKMEDERMAVAERTRCRRRLSNNRYKMREAAALPWRGLSPHRRAMLA
jgi:hypothetical protein